MKCPKCESDNTQKLSLVYASGVSDVNTTTSGVGVGMGFSSIGVGLGSETSKGTQQTLLSQASAPPQEIRYYVVFIIAVILSGMTIYFLNYIFLSYVIIFSIACGAVFWLKKLHYYNSVIFVRDYNTWNSQYMCLKCACNFIPS